jgi:hypothetical protein
LEGNPPERRINKAFKEIKHPDNKKDSVSVAGRNFPPKIKLLFNRLTEEDPTVQPPTQLLPLSQLFSS